MIRILILVAGLMAVPRAYAVPPQFDLNLFYFSDNFTYSDVASSYTRMMWDLSVGIPVTKKKRWIVGWNYSSYTMTESPASEETSLVITDMGPKVIYYLEKARNWQAAVTYNLIGRANYTAPGAEATELRGTSYKFEIGYLGQMWDKVFMGAKINYYSASFAEEISGETSIEKVTHGRAVIYPSFAMTIRWE